MLLPNQIAGFFNHQCLWKESISNSEFLHGGNHQGNLASETTTFGSIRSRKPGHIQTCLDLPELFKNNS